MGKLWQKDYSLDSLVEEFTVGRDYQLDHRLTAADIAASAAHAVMLESVGLLTPEELESLRGGLLAAAECREAGEFVISRGDEDGHTALENFLVDRCGEAGKKIHTGRSRNDQVTTALRVYGRGMIFRLQEAAAALTETLLRRGTEHRETPMPGRTHLQTAMPSSVGLWMGAWAEELLDIQEQLRGVYRLFDQCPLGAAASYGVPLPLDRELTARLLGFTRVQNNVLYVNNSRGGGELALLQLLDRAGMTLSRMAQDLILFSLPEFGYFSLPRELCSGSSIMPQKKNPDGLELMRGRAASLSAYTGQVRSILQALPSGYNRDLQETKEPFLMGVESAELMLRVMDRTVGALEVKVPALEAGFTPDIFATDAALERVEAGASFREAYREVGLHLEDLKGRDPRESLRRRTHRGAPGNPGLDAAQARLEVLRKEGREEATRVQAALDDLMGRPHPVA